MTRSWSVSVALVLCVCSIAIFAVNFSQAFAEETTDTPVVIETADAQSEADISNTANTNVVDTDSVEPIQTDTVDEGQQEGQEEQLVETEIEGIAGSEHTDIENENDAAIETDVNVGSSTGENVASGGGSASVQTGNAYASANVVTVVNTNVVNSDGLFFFLNNFLNMLGNIDTRGFANSTAPTLTCQNGCDGQTDSITDISNTNVATVYNDVVVRANTGGNEVDANGNAIIGTGDAYASANVVNVANTNIINSNYLLMVVNNFSDWNGDLILPNSDFFSRLFFGSAGASSTSSGNSATTVENTNDATVENNVTVAAETGENTVSGAEGEISTGNSLAGTSVTNEVNTNSFGGDSFMILFRVFGNWTGSIFNLPQNILWQQTPYGIALIGNGSSPLEALGSPSAQSTPAVLPSENDEGNDRELNVANNNTAHIRSNVEVYALTGANHASSTAGTASVQTGNAYASANVVNVANTNIVGRNWFLAIINIFGDWNGNVSFGQPDLWIGGSAVSQPHIGPSTGIEYHYTITNRGDADATNVLIESAFDNHFAAFNDSSVLHAPDSTHLYPYYVWNIGTIRAGETRDIVYNGMTAPSLPNGDTQINNTVRVFGTETDGNIDDNTDIVSVVATYIPQVSVGQYIVYTPEPKLTLTKHILSSEIAHASSTVDYKVVVKNTGGPAYHSILHDTLANELGDVISEHSWNLQTIRTGEEITVSYSVFFNASTTPGAYINTAGVSAIGRHPSLEPFYGWYADSNLASTTVTMLGDTNNWTVGVTVSEPVISSTLLPVSPAASSVRVTDVSAHIDAQMNAQAQIQDGITDVVDQAAQHIFVSPLVPPRLASTTLFGDTIPPVQTINFMERFAPGQFANVFDVTLPPVSKAALKLYGLLIAGITLVVASTKYKLIF